MKYDVLRLLGIQECCFSILKGYLEEVPLYRIEVVYVLVGTASNDVLKTCCFIMVSHAFLIMAFEYMLPAPLLGWPVAFSYPGRFEAKEAPA